MKKVVPAIRKHESPIKDTKVIEDEQKDTQIGVSPQKTEVDQDDEELQDEVQDLCEDTLSKLDNGKAAVPSTMPSRKSGHSMRSSRSSQYLAKLQAEIEDERKQRLQLQKDMEEMKKISSELMSQLNIKNSQEK